MQPTQEEIDRIKAQYPDREVFAIDAVDGSDQLMTFVMTGPSREEYRLFVEKVMAARNTKDEVDRIWAVRLAVENAALAQIRWPAKEECQAAFRRRPEMVDGFFGELQKAAGANVELRSKKL